MFQLALQNTLTKQDYVVDLQYLDDNSVYYKFNLESELPDGEYIYLLFENKDNLKVEINPKVFIDEKLISDKRILITYDGILSNGTQILIDRDNVSLPVLATGLIKVNYAN